MSTREKWNVLAKMKEMIDGYVGPWAQEALVLIQRLEANILDDETFATVTSQWDRHLAQAPASLWQRYIKNEFS